MTETAPELMRAADDAGQGHVFRYWDELDEGGRARLRAQVAALDFDEIASLAALLEGDSEAGSPSFEPPAVFPLRRDAKDQAKAAAASSSGTELLREGRVGYLLVAGGQGSRLGLDGPKGAFEIGPVSGRTLFEFHARRLRAAARRFGVATPWYVMTSPANDEPTRAFFHERDHFGLDPEAVFFFSQAMLPALDPTGKILLAGRDSLFLAPNGHGGVLSALRSSGALADMRSRGLQTLSYFQVDNPLAVPADPLFLGLHREAGAGMSSKVVAKRDPGEKVGVLGKVDGRMGCIEYSDLPEELREGRDKTGRLLFDAGNIAVHAIEVDFIDELTSGEMKLPWHLARKKVRALDDDGQQVDRDGIKFETFVFDALGRSENSVTLEVDRALEFSPVKNAAGEDSPNTCRRDLCAIHAGWARAAGLDLPTRLIEEQPAVEIDPLLAESVEELLAAGPPEPKIVDGGHLFEGRP